MSKKDKLVARIRSKPKDFVFDEALTLLKLCGYTVLPAVKTGGSRVCFARGKKIFRMHKPHPHKELHAYQVKDLIDELEQEGLI